MKVIAFVYKNKSYVFQNEKEIRFKNKKNYVFEIRKSCVVSMRTMHHHTSVPKLYLLILLV